MAGFNSEIDIANGGTFAAIGEGDIVEDDVACDGCQGFCAGLIADGGFESEHIEESPQFWGLAHHMIDEANQGFHAADQHDREADEGHNLADSRQTGAVQCDADDENSEHCEGCGGSRDHLCEGPPDQNRCLGSQQIVDDVPECRSFALDAGKALDHRKIAERVGGVSGKIGMKLFDIALKFFCPVHDESSEARKKGEQEQKHECQTPVDEECCRKHQAQQDDGSAMFAQDIEPNPCCAIRAFERYFQQLPGMIAVMKSERECQRMFEKCRNHC